jgi:hypothetical protein
LEKAAKSQITTKKVIGYVALPGVIPRCRELFTSGFGHLSFLMAQIYAMVRLLPEGHAYLNPQNMGQFGIRHVVAEAANHLVFKKENIDQILIFFAVGAAVILLISQFIAMFYGFVFQPAQAFSLFQTPDPKGEFGDIALTMMDHVFGVPEFFCTVGNVCSDVLAGGATPFHLGLQALFRFYSLALLMVAILIFLYFVIVVVVETAATGTPFGQRFQNIWAPIRLVMAVGMLVPLAHGYNTAQYITFFAAKAGSGFATNAWIGFNQASADNGIKGSSSAGGSGDGLNSNPIGESETLVARNPQVDFTPIVEAMSLAHACKYAHRKVYSIGTTEFKVKPYFAKSPKPGASGLGALEVMAVGTSTGYSDALAFFNNGDIVIRFGWSRPSDDSFKKYDGQIEPTCGDIRIKTHSGPIEVEFEGPTTGEDAGYTGEIDPYKMISEAYYNFILHMWNDEDKQFSDFAARSTELAIDTAPKVEPCDVGKGNEHLHQTEPACHSKSPKNTWKQARIDHYNTEVEVKLNEAWKALKDAAPLNISHAVLDRGWGGAGIWYNKIAQINGAFISTVLDVPELDRYPLVMEEVRKQRRANNPQVDGLNEFSPRLAARDTRSPNDLSVMDSRDVDIAIVLNEVYQYWFKDGFNLADADKQPSGNFIKNAVNMLLGTSGLFDIRGKNAYIHPLAQLVAIGKGLVESAVRNMAGATITSFMGGLLGAAAPHSGSGAAMKALSGFFSSTAFLGLTAGFILFYILPFMPFMYVFFAVGGWVKSIFEAMVGTPLWALAHLRVDGDGLPGDAASNGYFLIFEIFVRPILIVFGLIAAVLVLTAQVRVLNLTFDLMTSNVGGFNDNQSVGLGGDVSFRRSEIDQLFFTILYAIMVYLMATASFKLIDEIPKSILRWIGAGVSSFGDVNEDPKEGLQKYAAIGGITVGQQLTGSITKSADGLGGALGNAVNPKPKV